MPPSEPYYAVQVPMIGQPDNYYTLCRCISIDNAVEVVRVLLESKDPEVSQLCVRVIVPLSPLPT